MIEEKETSGTLIEAVKQRIEYMEVNDPENVTLKLLKRQISDYISVKDKF
ncbi:MAG: hypothetical protein GY777_07025 [Candidatus Brocadiaceae bacterium]|nr:hypothetical protein [Candidatus Brocadiaceae bacterium]